MIAITSQQAFVAAAILNCVLDPHKPLRTAKALAKAAGVSDAQTVIAALSLGLMQRRRKSDGALLFGIQCRVDDCQDVPAPTPAATHANEENEQARDRVHNALVNRRWNKRSLTRLQFIAGVGEVALYEILEFLGARIEDGYAYYVGQSASV